MNIYKHMKRWSTLFGTRETKMMVKFYYMPTRMAVIKRLIIVNADENEEKLELSYNNGKLV